ncbi:MAG: type II secretion system protein [Pseudomonadota bacterium]
MKKQQAGFTLIELVLVIVILGILAATALPRFSDLSTEARIAAVNGLAGGVRSASALAKATQLAKSLGSSTAITMEGVNIDMLNRYPDASTTGIQAALSDITGFGAFGAVTANAFEKTGAGTPANCAVGYTAATATVGPVITTSTGGC